MTEIKPCPKCGGKANYFINPLSPGGYYVRCLDCFKRTTLYDTSEEAILAWNEEATPLTDGSGDRESNTLMALCCKEMLGLFTHNRLHVGILNGKVDLYIRGEGILGDDRWVTPLRYCPSCGKEIRLTFLADSEEGE